MDDRIQLTIDHPRPRRAPPTGLSRTKTDPFDARNQLVAAVGLQALRGLQGEAFVLSDGWDAVGAGGLGAVRGLV